MFLMFGIDYKFKKSAKLGITLVAIITGYLSLKSSFLTQIGNYLAKIGISSRSINALINGIISDDNGRNVFKNKALEFIAEGGPFGTGFCSSRYFFNGSYPHNIFLELWIDMGYVGGTIIIILLIWGIVKFFTRVRDYKWRCLFIALFACAFGKLMVSSSLWLETFFWEALAIGIVAVEGCDQRNPSISLISKIYKYRLK